MALVLIVLNGCQPAFQETVIIPPATANSPPVIQTSALGATIQPTGTTPTQIPFAKTSPTATPTASLTATSCSDAQGQVIEMNLEDGSQMGRVIVQVFLPPCYPSEEDAPYPLVVLLHGQGYDQNHWLDLGLVDTADRLIASSQIPPMIILMPLEEYAYQDPYDSSFDEMIIDFLLPWAAENFSACEQTACRGVGGISRGGAWALRIGGNYPGVFSAVGMHSAPPFPADQYRLVRVLRDLPESQRPRLFMDVGDIDTYRGYIFEFHEGLVEQGVPHSWNTSEGGHDNAYWRTHVEDYLLWYGDVLASP